ncbi:hypothetical protein E3P81_03647 [Wallemia ichthyophaga]|nr:hypothetical protein E3P91_03329 [Wallemia ichthyophaga]TIA88109.1 hypothetical protein E3P97_03655 [Wallemia ichthyophaga]TIB05515.1 hypothetical protein E3P96_01171 [Wallemia ichthyophaga]TIB28692.1 hypothetical protein E3P85_03521 [Wallemia ichthyophaga]TIB44180.1 hypothetical protein E3P82_03652 [Wallemia ichthyophaga]
MDLNIAAAGSLAALTVDLLVYPMDTLKVRIQSTSSATLFSVSKSHLYAGVGPVILATIPSAAVFFTTYEHMTGVFNTRTNLSSPATQILASNLAECASCAVLAPAELIKQNAQVGGDTKTLTKRLLRRDNLKSLFPGYRALVLRNTPIVTVQWPIYEHLRAMLGERNLPRAKSAFLAASAAATIASIATNPIDVIKTRIMIQNEQSGGVWSTSKSVMANEGVRGLFRGCLLRSTWAAAGAGVYLGSFEKSKEILGK